MSVEGMEHDTAVQCRRLKEFRWLWNLRFDLQGQVEKVDARIKRLEDLIERHADEEEEA